jgi:hypothetical protein
VSGLVCTLLGRLVLIGDSLLDFAATFVISPGNTKTAAKESVTVLPLPFERVYCMADHPAF